MIRYITLILLCFFLSSPSYAFTATQQEAAHLKSVFTDVLKHQKIANEAFGSMTVNFIGNVTVTPKGDHYDIFWPRILLKETKTNDKGKDIDVVFDLGIITSKAFPPEIIPSTTQSKTWDIYMTLPDKMVLSTSGSDGVIEDDFEIWFGTQNIKGLFYEDLGYFTKLDLNLGDIQFTYSTVPTGISLGGLHVRMDLEEHENDPSRFSGPIDTELKNLLLTAQKDGKGLFIGALNFDVRADSFKLPTLSAYKEKIQKHKKTIAALNAPREKTEKAITAEQDQISGTDVTNMILDLYDFDMDGFGVSFGTKDFSVTETENPDDEGKQTKLTRTTKINELSFGLSVEHLKTEKGALDITTKLNGFHSIPEDPELKDVAPENVLLSLRAVNVPYLSLTQMGNNTAQAIANNPDMAQMAGIGVVMRLPALLAQAGTKLVMSETGLKNKTYDVSLNGDVVTDPTAIIGFAAKFRMVFAGLDKLLSIVKTRTKNPDSKHYKDFTNLLDMLRTLKSNGNPSMTGEAYTFNIETSPQGQVLMNGKNAQALFAPETPAPKSEDTAQEH